MIARFQMSLSAASVSKSFSAASGAVTGYKAMQPRQYTIQHTRSENIDWESAPTMYGTVSTFREMPHDIREMMRIILHDEYLKKDFKYRWQFKVALQPFSDDGSTRSGVLLCHG
jgi:hypothetical protein